MNLHEARRLMPMTGQPVHINPAPDSRAFIDRQCARIARSTDPDELARCRDNLRRAAHTSVLGWMRVHLPAFKW